MDGSEAKSTTATSDKKIQDKGGAQVSLFTDSAFFDGLLWLREAIFFSSQKLAKKRRQLRPVVPLIQKVN